MSNDKKLAGAAPKGTMGFVTPKGVTDRTSAIAAVIKRNVDNDFRAEVLGTAFFINEAGVFVTARHVAEELVRPETGNHHAAQLIQLLPGETIITRRVLTVTLHGTADIAVGCVADQMNQAGDKFSSSVFNLKGAPAAAGDLVWTWAFPKSRSEYVDGQNHVHMDPDFFAGRVVEHYPVKRDNYNLSWPCYQTDMHLHGGSSGGPAVDEHGLIFGVNCSSFDPDTDVSFVTDINLALDLSPGPIVFKGQSENFTIRELIGMGRVRIGK